MKSRAADCILLMQVKAADARAVAEVTGLKLQRAGDVDAPLVLGGFPKSGLDAYVGKLVRAGHSVAIAVKNDKTEKRYTRLRDRLVAQ